MTPAWITAVEVHTAAGRGLGALVDAVSEGRDLRRLAPWAWTGLTAPGVAFVPDTELLPGAPGRAYELLEGVVAAVLPGPRPARTALVVATSSGAISGDFEEAMRAAPRARAGGPVPTGWRAKPTLAVAERHGLHPALTISVACASGSAAFAVAQGLLAEDLADAVVVAGVDALSEYLHAGFAGLGALSPGRCRPFDVDRDGILLGEGAAAILLESPGSARAGGRIARAVLQGVGLSQDATHLTAPDRTGGGLERAARAALGDVDATSLSSVSAHGTGTRFNDGMEALALGRLFGASPVPLHALKGVIGHTLGAAGVIEAAYAVALIEGAPCAAPPTSELLSTRPTLPGARSVLSLNAAFGGVNAAILLTAPSPGDLLPRDAAPADPAGFGRPTRSTSPARPRPADLHLHGDAWPLATLLAGRPAPPTLGRTDAYVRAGVAALASLSPDAEAPLVLSSTTDCHAADVRFFGGVLAQGPAHASRLHFPYTIPGAPIAEASILLGLRGPTLTVCGGAADGALVAALLARRGPSGVHLHVEAPAAHADVQAWTVPSHEP